MMFDLRISKFFYDNCVLPKKKITNSFIRIIIQNLVSNWHLACAIISCPLNHLPNIFLQLTLLKLINLNIVTVIVFYFHSEL